MYGSRPQRQSGATWSSKAPPIAADGPVHSSACAHAFFRKCRTTWLTSQAAKDEILDNMHQCERALRAVSHWEALMQEREEKKEQLAVKASVSRYFSAFRRYPILDACMERHSAAFHGLATRLPFAAIVGESNTGKAQLAQSLYGADSTFYCNVQNAEEPNLKGFARGNAGPS